MSLRVLFDIVHPADVHFFKHSVRYLLAAGHQVLLTSRVKDIVVQLLRDLNFDNQVVSQQGRGPIGLIAELVRRDAEMTRLARRFRPNVLVGNNSPSVAHVGFLLRRPSVVFDDTEINRYVRMLYRGLVTEIHTPRCYRLDLGSKQIRYLGHHALAYLHPHHFRFDAGVIAAVGLSTDEPYFLFRFVKWGASHDLGVNGLALEKKEQLVNLANRYGRVVISSEDALPASLQAHRLTTKVTDLHHVLAGAAGLVGESATMCSEAASLGRPSLLIDPFGRGYTDELEQEYGLVNRVPPQRWDEVLAAAERLFQGGREAQAAAGHRRFLADMVDVSAYQLAQIERLANSAPV